MSLLGKLPAGVKPIGAVELDRSNPIAQYILADDFGFCLLAVPGGMLELKSGKLTSPTYGGNGGEFVNGGWRNNSAGTVSFTYWTAKTGQAQYSGGIVGRIETFSTFDDGCGMGNAVANRTTMSFHYGDTGQTRVQSKSYTSALDHSGLGNSSRDFAFAIGDVDTDLTSESNWYHVIKTRGRVDNKSNAAGSSTVFSRNVLWIGDAVGTAITRVDFAIMLGDSYLPRELAESFVHDPYQIVRPVRPLTQIITSREPTYTKDFSIPEPRLEMPALMLPGKQPTGPVTVDKSHPIAPDYSWHFHQASMSICPELVQGKDATANSGASSFSQYWEATPRGWGPHIPQHPHGFSMGTLSGFMHMFSMELLWSEVDFNSSAGLSDILQLQSTFSFKLVGGSSTSYLTNESLTLWGQSNYRRGITDGSSWNGADGIHVVVYWNGSNYEFIVDEVEKDSEAGTQGDVPLTNLGDTRFIFGSSTWDHTLGHLSIWTRPVTRDEALSIARHKFQYLIPA